MRGSLLLVAAAAWAQDNRGFVNQRLVTQNFVKNSLKAPNRAAQPQAPSGKCEIPLIRIAPTKDVDSKMVIALPKDSGDEKMIVPASPACPVR